MTKRPAGLATEHLIDMGCRRVAHIRGQDNSTGVGRFEGYRQALHRPRISIFVKTTWCAEPMWIRKPPVKAPRPCVFCLKRDPKPDGVFCFNDPLAIGAMSHDSRRRPENSGRHCSDRLRKFDRIMTVFAFRFRASINTAR